MRHRGSVGFEELPRKTGLADDGLQRADTNFSMIRNRHGTGRFTLAPLHQDVAAALADSFESVFGEQATQIPAGEYAQPNQTRPRPG